MNEQAQQQQQQAAAVSEKPPLAADGRPAVPSMFAKAIRYGFPVKVTVEGVTKSGKTYGALRLATALEGKIALIETEPNQSRMYADQFDFDIFTLTRYPVEQALDLIANAEAAGYTSLVVDSLSHFWAGRDGILEYKDSLAAGSGSRGDWGNWALATPKHRALIEGLIFSPLNVIATMRVKTEWLTERDERGKTKPTRVGLAPIQREDVPSEFHANITLDQAHSLWIAGKCPALDNWHYEGAGAVDDFGAWDYIAQELKAWAHGAPMPEALRAAMREAQQARPAAAAAARPAGRTTTGRRPPPTPARVPGAVEGISNWATLFNALMAHGKTYKNLEALKGAVNALTLPTDAIPVPGNAATWQALYKIMTADHPAGK